MLPQIQACGKVVFPMFRGGAVNCNMLPFIIGDPESIPPLYRRYYSLVERCLPRISKDEIGRVGYLSISESIVGKNKTQRRPGIHTEGFHGGGWGGGWGGYTQETGLFMASTQDKTCRAWGSFVQEPGRLGDCEHLRETLQNPIDMRENTLYWMTDRCPHEALAQLEEGERQWFRFVTSGVDAWWTQHSTLNEFGVVPPPSCRIITQDKFGQRVQE